VLAFAIQPVHNLTLLVLYVGVLGGTVHEAMTDVIHLMASLVNSQGSILVDGIMDDVKPVTPEEEALYDNIEFDVEEFKVCGNTLLLWTIDFMFLVSGH